MHGVCHQVFMHRVRHQGNVISETTFLVGCGQFRLLSSQIAGFFDHKFLWKESIDILVVVVVVFLHGDNH